MKGAVGVLAITILTASSLFAQVHIRESVGITPSLKVTNGFDDATHPVWLRVGGTLTVKLVQLANIGGDTKSIGEETTGKTLIDNFHSVGDSIVFDGVRQWTKFILYADIQVSHDSVAHLYPPECSVIGCGTSYVYFSTGDQPWTDIWYDVELSLTLTPDYSLDAIPPSGIYDGAYLVNPFEPRDLTLPTGGDAFLTIDAANSTNQGDNLYMELPNQTSLVSIAPASVGDTIPLGHFQCGDPLRLYLQSGNPVVGGMKLYPEISQEGTVPIFLPDGREAQIVGTMSFDDWTDLIYDKLSCTVYVVSDTSNVMVQIDPPEVSPGDTATIIVKKHGNCQVTDYPPDQLFNVGILGDSTGTILSSDGTDTASYFTNIPAGFKFIAPDSINGDSAVVYIEVGIPPVLGPPCSISAANNKFAMQNKPTKNNGAKGSKSHAKQILTEKTNVAIRRSLSVPSDNDFGCNDYGITVGIVEPRTILLGETNYYYATEENGQLIIHETDDPSSNPGIKSPSLIMEDLTIADDAVNNDKIGAYWDYLDATGNDLPDGMIRVIGRYWKQDTTYKVRLHAVNLDDGSEGAIEITVKKPAKLGNTNSSVKDVFGNDLNLDSLIIRYAGEYGIPPQIIKGQMQQESSTFTPAWRYEPFQDVKIQNGDDPDRYFADDLPFVVDETTMGSGDKPDHSNEDPLPYLDTPTKIASYTVDHWNNYVQHHTGDKPDIIVGDSSLSSRWLKIYGKIKVDNGAKISDDEARTEAHDELKQEMQDVTVNIGKFFDHMAQTRKVTSYGFTQMMYITAADNCFNNNHDQCYDLSSTYYVDQTDERIYPEKLNEQDFLMPCYCDFLWKKLNFTFTTCIPEGNWQGGLESHWDQALVKYNGASDYGEKVFANAENYLPSN